MGAVSKIQSIKHLTHDVLQIRLDKPEGIEYTVGQAADVSINTEKWKDELRAFTFTSLPQDDFIEFIIKTYPSHNGLTNELLKLTAGDELIVGDVFGDISYKGEGLFIAGGAGITPFLAIFKKLDKENKLGNNKLLFANKGQEDIILKDKLNAMLGDNFITILSNEQTEKYEHGFINEAIIKKYSTDNLKYYYLCGPDLMMEAVEKHLSALGVAKDNIIREAF